MEWSFRNFLLDSEQHRCEDCDKSQDVLLYCLEDAIVSMLIYVWYEINKNKLESNN